MYHLLNFFCISIISHLYFLAEGMMSKLGRQSERVVYINWITMKFLCGKSPSSLNCFLSSSIRSWAEFNASMLLSKSFTRCPWYAISPVWKMYRTETIIICNYVIFGLLGSASKIGKGVLKRCYSSGEKCQKSYWLNVKFLLLGEIWLDSYWFNVNFLQEKNVKNPIDSMLSFSF